MLYRLVPPTTVTWCDVSHRTIDLVQEHPEADLERLEWLPAEKPLSDDFLRLAVRHGAATTAGLVVAAIHLTELGRAEELRQLQAQGDRAQAELRATSAMQQLDRLFPGTIQTGVELDEKIRDTTERVARESEQDLAEDLAVPPKQELIEHWRRLGGRYPD